MNIILHLKLAIETMNSYLFKIEHNTTVHGSLNANLFIHSLLHIRMEKQKAKYPTEQCFESRITYLGGPYCPHTISLCIISENFNSLCGYTHVRANQT